jgi:uncharacterized membrane protein
MQRTLTIFTFVIFFSSQHFSQNNSQFIDLGPGGAAKVSNNGIYVCGNNYPAPAFLWTDATGRIDLGVTYTEAFGISDNGIVAGSFIDSTLPAPNGNPTLRAGYYDGTNWVALPGYPGYPVLDEMSYNYGYGISADGSIIVGMHWLPTWRAEACYWDISGIHMLGRTGGQSSRANDVAITGNGFIIAGWDGDSTGPDRRAFYWDPAPHFMGGYDTTYPAGQCEGLNSDGSKIVGGSVGAPFVWNEATGMEWITTNYLNNASYAKDISDNNIIVGFVSPSVGNFQAFIKRPEWEDIIFLKDYLIDSLGITGISDWYFPFANSISADGLTIVGTAYPPGAGPNAYVVKLENTVPVELTSFTADYFGNTVALNWSTAGETNNLGFSVERKTDNAGWSEIAFIPGNGTSTEPNFYSYPDNSVSNNKYYYRLKQQDFDGSFEYSNVIEIDVTAVTEFSLRQNYPNPFNPSTTIELNIPVQALVNLSVYNLLGEKVAALVDELMEGGNYKIEFNASQLASGIYLIKMSAGNFSDVIKINLLK